jgi:hypothetical protein
LGLLLLLLLLLLVVVVVVAAAAATVVKCVCGYEVSRVSICCGLRWTLARPCEPCVKVQLMRFHPVVTAGTAAHACKYDSDGRYRLWSI